MEYIKVGKSHGIIGFLESITGITGTEQSFNQRDRYLIENSDFVQ